MVRTRREKVEPVEEEDEIAIVFETTPSQLPGSGNGDGLEDEEEVVPDSEGEEIDEVDDKPMNLDGVNSQMGFFPIFTSTQHSQRLAKRAPKAVVPQEKENTVVKDRKRKKTSALTDRPVKKTLTSTTMATERTFNFTAAGSSVLKSRKISVLEDLPPKRVKNSTSMEKGVKTPVPMESKEEDREESKTSKVKSVDVSLVSSGKKYEIEESHSFLSQTRSGRSMFSEEDIDQVVASMKDLVEVMVLTRQTLSPTLAARTCSQNNMKKFKKAAQGRYNPQLPCSGVLIGEEDLRDWTSFCD